MIDPITPVTEDEFHAFVDGELPEDRRDAVEDWLAKHPDDAEQVAAWRTQADAIRARYGAVANEPTPERLKLDRLTRRRYARAGMVAAAVLAAFLAGGVAGWTVRGVSTVAPGRFDPFTAEALSAHRLYIAEVRHPIEVKAGERHLVPWLSRRVGTTLRAPDLGKFGLKLLGGRLLPGLNGPAALFMYEGANGERFTLYSSTQRQPQMAFRYNVVDKFAAVHWIDSEIGFVMSGPADRDRLGKIAQSAYEQLENRAPARRSDSGQLMSRRGS
ncbi:MAG: anti-sigma factor [Rhizobiales bacterium]|nr:anti-sigma factor [Hyphomicrobiales bacterium]